MLDSSPFTQSGEDENPNGLNHRDAEVSSRKKIENIEPQSAYEDNHTQR
jgi:hypothetical protein